MGTDSLKDETNKKKRRSRYFFGASVTILMALLLFAGLSRAWFANEQDIATMVQVTDPTALSLRGPHGKTQAALDMSYTEADKDSNGKVTIRRVVSVCTDADHHQLEIVHTTNLKGLTFKVYPATESTSGNITEAGYSYTYDNELAGKYINPTTASPDYKEANADKHNVNFGNYYEVQAHAEPLYWLANGSLAGISNLNGNSENDFINKDIEKKYVNYYVIEISWTETQKETDLFYVIAQNAQATQTGNK